MSILFSPLTLRGLTARNRLWVAPMCQYSAVDGIPQEWHHTHLAQFASGGAGIVIAEATAVNPEARISPEDTGLWNDAQRDAWAPIAAAIRARGALAGVQLAHAGRKASTWSPFSGHRGSVPQRRRRLEHRRAVRRRIRRVRRARRDGCRRDRGRRRRLRRRRASRDRGRLPGDRDPRRARLPAAPVPLAAVEPARRRVRRLAARTAPACCCGSSTRSGMPHPTRRCSCGSRPPTGPTAAGTSRRPRTVADVGGRARRRLLRHLQRRARRAPEHRRRTGLSGRVRRGGAPRRRRAGECRRH